MMNTKLYKNLPCIADGDDYIIFSPYAKKVAKVNSSILDSDELYEEFKKQNFFGTPFDYPEQCSELYNLVIVITSDCNLRCKYCFANCGDKSRTIESKVVEESIDYVIRKLQDTKNKKGLLVNFFGGEPTIALETIKHTMNYVKEKIPNDLKYRFALTTNGVFSDDVLHFLVENNFFITLSIDGTPDIQDKLRPLPTGEGSSKYVERTIRNLSALGANFLVRSTITNNSVNKMPDIVKYLAELGAKTLHFEAVNLAGRAKEEKLTVQRPDPEVFADKLIESIETAKLYNISIMNSSFMNILTPSLHFCDGSGGNKIIVNYDGYYTTCLEVQDNCHPASDDFVIGDYKNKIAEKSPLDKPAIEKIEKCKTCFAKYICSGGCPMRNFHMKGNVHHIDEFRCSVIQKLLKYSIIRIYNDSLAAE